MTKSKFCDFTEMFSFTFFSEAITTAGKWTAERVRLLIQLRLEMESQFRSGRSRHLLWPQIYHKLKAADPSLTESLKNVQKKYNNLITTYKRIKAMTSRNQTNHSKWEFFDDFDDIFSQLGETQDDSDQANVRYVKVEKIDDDSVSFSSDDGDVPMNYKNVVAYKPKSPIKTTVSYGGRSSNNGIASERITTVPVNEPEKDTKKRKILPDVGGVKVQKITKISPTKSTNDNESWFREYLKRNEQNEQRRYEQQEQLLALERKRIEIETNNCQLLQELVDVVKKFVNK